MLSDARPHCSADLGPGLARDDDFPRFHDGYPRNNLMISAFSAHNLPIYVLIWYVASDFLEFKLFCGLFDKSGWDDMT